MIVGRVTDLGTDVGSAGTLGMLLEEVPGKTCNHPLEDGCGKVIFYLSPLETTVRIIEGDGFRFASITELGARPASARLVDRRDRADVP